MKPHRRTALTVSLLTTVAYHAMAQAPAGPATQDSSQLQEITVTAQKREQSASSVGMAITAVSGDELKEFGVNGIADLTKIEPSFVLSQSLWGGPVYAIRGVGYNDFSIAAAPTVSVYQDEVPYTYNALTQGAAFDLERVEVLKGPQGTLFGQNATGGAINYIAAKPTDSFEAGIAATYGRFDAANFNGYVSGPLAETIRVRFAFDIDQGGAWQHSDTRDDTLGNKDTKRARLLLDWAPVDRLKVSLNLNGWADNSQNQVPQFNALALTKPALAVYIPNTVNEPIAPRDAEVADWLEGTRPANDERFYQSSLRIEYSPTDAINVTYLASYEHYTANDWSQASGINTNFQLNQRGQVQTVYQELRLNGKLIDDKLDWLVGADYSSTDSVENQYEPVLGSSAAYALVGLPGGTKPFDAVANVSSQTNSSGAGFGNLEYYILDSLDVHGGARWTKTDLSDVGCTQDVDGNLASDFTKLETIVRHDVGVVPISQGQCVTESPTYIPGVVRNVLDQTNTSWRVGADWTPVAKTLLYATASKGSKAGSFPVIAASTSVQLNPARQESVTAYELGVKSRLGDNKKVELDGALFYYDYDNKQLALRQPNAIFGTLNALLNVPRSLERGAELSAKFRPVSGLTLNASLTYLYSEVLGNFFNYNQFTATSLNLKGEAFPDTPRLALGAGARYDWNLNRNYSAYVGADERYQTKTQSYFGAANAVGEGFPSEFNDAYAVLDLRAGVLSHDGHWSYAAFANNVTNKFYTTQFVNTVDSTARYVGMPATWGITVRYTY
jgi:iron complex outermembrane recepter protein